MPPLLLRVRSGKTAARAIAFGFGGGTLLLGAVSLLAGIANGASVVVGGMIGYALGALPFFVLAVIVGLCKTELWFVPEVGVFEMLTFRPWRLNPRVEQAPVSEYTGVKSEALGDEDGGGFMVSLVAANGEIVPMRQFTTGEESARFAENLATLSGLWLRAE